MTCGRLRPPDMLVSELRLLISPTAEIATSCGPPPKRPRPALILRRRGEGHREADSAALADLVPDGQRAPGFGARDQARGRGLQLDERRCVRASVLCRPRRAREPRDLAPGREARRGLLRGGALCAAARELLPAPDRVHRRRAGGVAHRPRAARRGIRLRRAPAARPPAGLLGAAEPVAGGGCDLDRRQTRCSRRGSGHVAAPGQDRDGDLTPQDDRVQLLLDAARRGLRPPGRSLPPRVPQRPVLPDRPRPRTGRGACVPPLADSRQGLLRDQGRARLSAPRGLRSSRLRVAGRLADGGDPGHREGVRAGADRLAGGAGLRAATASCARRPGRTASPGAGRSTRPSTRPAGS